jgi:aminoglycoside/choline kinase family phosphotransferase
MTDRQAQIRSFLEGAGWGGAAIRLLAGDASFRKYYRLDGPDGRAVLMDAPPPQEDVRPFVKIALHLADMGFSAPRILARDEATGFLLLDDLGDDTYTRLLAAGRDEEALYSLAIDALAALHRHPKALEVDLPAYDDARLLTEALLMPDWFMPAVGRPADAAATADYHRIWLDLFPLARRVPDTIVLRDFHVDNLMLLDRPGLAACGLLDFQDAVAGPLTYDPMSLLEDARRDIDPGLIAAMKDRYLQAMPHLDPADFESSWAVLAAQRHCKVIGIFTRLWKRDGKPIYLQHIPRVWRLLERACVHPALAGLRDWLDREVPAALRRAPTP